MKRTIVEIIVQLLSCICIAIIGSTKGFNAIITIALVLTLLSVILNAIDLYFDHKGDK